ncbi:YcxB family protein [Fulvivirga sediminis]|uniref:YcxB family protein n=1 Tax=Fulvivirga sediminis TaxID=2803949 RepID=A0A937K2X3_9BACT|nr:YcxB family protein [Fulvivirga sediminis]MBL3658317.1 YcxB family protein [Fulvivirga sediminis]
MSVEKYRFSLEEEDYLTHQLYTASQSKSGANRRKWRWFFMTGIMFVFSFFFYQKDNMWLTLYFAIIGVIVLALYPVYLKWLYKRHYRRYIRDRFSDQFGKTITLELYEDQLISKDEDNTQSKFAYRTVDQITNLPKHFLINVKSGEALIIPKERVNDIDQLEAKLKYISDFANADYSNQQNWKWK